MKTIVLKTHGYVEVKKVECSREEIKSSFLRNLIGISETYLAARDMLEENQKTINHEGTNTRSIHDIQELTSLILMATQDNNSELHQSMNELKDDIETHIHAIEAKEVSECDSEVLNAISMIEKAGDHMTSSELNILSHKYRNFSIVQRILKQYMAEDTTNRYFTLYPTLEDMKLIAFDAIEESMKILLYGSRLKWEIFLEVSMPRYDRILSRNELLEDDLKLLESISDISRLNNSEENSIDKNNTIDLSSVDAGFDPNANTVPSGE